MRLKYRDKIRGRYRSQRRKNKTIHIITYAKASHAVVFKKNKYTVPLINRQEYATVWTIIKYLPSEE